MSKGLRAVVVSGAVWAGAGVLGATQSPPSVSGIGHAPLPSIVSERDVTVFPDGRGLPPGHGTAREGRVVFTTHCAACHGASGEGSNDFPRLVGGVGTLQTSSPVLTVGSYWPYATTLWDYTRRAMPYTQPGLLTDSEVYAVTAYILRMNGIVKEDDVLDARSLVAVRMPNRAGFVGDARPDWRPRP
ncbi:MAG: cytochrome c [Vicinamibacteraceae bacterium]